MSNLNDVRQVLQGYYVSHAGLRADYDKIEQYLERAPEERRSTRSAFQAWFEHHRTMQAKVRKGEDTYFHPHFQQHLDDNGDFVAHLKRMRAPVLDLEQKISEALKEAEETEELRKSLHEYVSDSRQLIVEDETIFVPLILQHYTRETFRKLELDYVKKLPLKEQPIMVPWAGHCLTDEDRKLFLSLLPWPARFLNSKFWEPSYVKRYQF